MSSLSACFVPLQIPFQPPGKLMGVLKSRRRVVWHSGERTFKAVPLREDHLDLDLCFEGLDT